MMMMKNNRLRREREHSSHSITKCESCIDSIPHFDSRTCLKFLTPFDFWFFTDKLCDTEFNQ